MALIPRGIRNNNPGNIEKGAPWIGLSDDQDDQRFAVFTHHLYGLRAMARILRTYQREHGIKTLRGAIERWAPPGENPTSGYADFVARRAGVPADAPTDFEDDAALARIMREMVCFENALRQPYDPRDYVLACEIERVG